MRDRRRHFKRWRKLRDVSARWRAQAGSLIISVLLKPLYYADCFVNAVRRRRPQLARAPCYSGCCCLFENRTSLSQRFERSLVGAAATNRLGEQRFSVVIKHRGLFGHKQAISNELNNNLIGASLYGAAPVRCLWRRSPSLQLQLSVTPRVLTSQNPSPGSPPRQERVRVCVKMKVRTCNRGKLTTVSFRDKSCTV